MTNKQKYILAVSRVLFVVTSVAFAITSNAGDVAKTDKPYLNQPENFQFAIVGDRTGEHREGVFASAVGQLNLLRPEFVISVGDLIEGYSEDKQVLEQEWQEFDAHVKGLDMPFYYVVGNHDMGNDVMLEMWRQRLGPTYYHFVYKGVLFIALNTEDPPTPMDPKVKVEVGELIALSKTDPQAAQSKYEQLGPALAAVERTNISKKQVRYVEKVLKQNKDVRWTFLFMHKPAWEHPSPVFEKIEALLDERPYTVFGGHMHNYLHSERNGRDYIRLGTTGGTWMGRDPAGDFDHITWVSMTDDGPTIANLLMSGIRDKKARENMMPQPE